MNGEGHSALEANPPPVVGHVDEAITPELVLVDPELRARVLATAVAGPSYPVAGPVLQPAAPPVRRTLPPAPRPLAELALPAARSTAPSRSTPARREAEQPHVRRHPGRRVRLPRARTSTLALTAALAAFLGAAFLPPRDAPHLLRSTDVGAAPGSRVALSWKPSRIQTDRYLVEFYRGSRLVHAETVGRASIRVPAWLRPGRYSWRVWLRPAQAGSSAPERLVENGWFLIPS